MANKKTERIGEFFLEDEKPLSEKEICLTLKPSNMVLKPLEPSKNQD